jgi:hypothetical protein
MAVDPVFAQLATEVVVRDAKEKLAVFPPVKKGIERERFY